MLKVDLRKLEKYAKAQCTLRELAAVCKVSHDTLERRFASKIEIWRDTGKAYIREAMYKKGIKGDVTMLRHLGKHCLNQHDQMNLTTSSEPEVRKLLSYWDNNSVNSVQPMITPSCNTPLQVQKQALAVVAAGSGA